MLTTTAIADVEPRTRVVVRGRVRSLRVRPWGDHPTLEVDVFDETGGLTAVFLARRRIAGINLGTEMDVEGVVSSHHGALTILNPAYELRTSSPGDRRCRAGPVVVLRVCWFRTRGRRSSVP